MVDMPSPDAMQVGAPPPPSEVKIRTMKSDLAGLAASGGGMPKFESVKVTGLSIEKGVDTPEAVHRSNAVTIVIVTIVAAVILGILGYVAYRIATTGKI
ncbi:MAG TPA: hypothetical protein VMT99_03035 [Candidatus Paceibacterota bacterium]|nr:hypothetical protein [Candidatus Paceibacterota bacterium]